VINIERYKNSIIIKNNEPELLNIMLLIDSILGIRIEKITDGIMVLYIDCIYNHTASVEVNHQDYGLEWSESEHKVLEVIAESLRKEILALIYSSSNS